MAIIHRAYTFKPVSFHARLEQYIYHDGYIHVDALQSLARSIVKQAATTTLRALSDLRFDLEWFEASNDRVSWTTHWYMVVLADSLLPTPSLSNRSPISWKIIETILPYEGWSKNEVKQLTRGQMLHTLVESTDNPSFVAEFNCIDQFGGWLPQENIEKFFSRLLALNNQIADPTFEVIDSISEYADLWAKDPYEMIMLSYKDALEMLRASLDRKEVLFMILD